MDVADFYGSIPMSMRATVAELDGRVVGIAGYYMAQGVAFVFSDCKAELPKMTIWREAVKYMQGLTIPAICVASEGSERFLERLGWKHLGGNTYGFGV